MANILKENKRQKAHYLGDFLNFFPLGAILGPLEGPLGATVNYFLLLHILLLNILQTGPIPRFYINPKRKYKNNKVKKHEFGLFLVVARTP